MGFLSKIMDYVQRRLFFTLFYTEFIDECYEYECYLRQLKHFVMVKNTNDNCWPMTYFIQHSTSCIGTECLHRSFWGSWAEKAEQYSCSDGDVVTCR